MSAIGSQPFPLTTLKGGINRLKTKGNPSPDSLFDLVNGLVTQAGSVIPRDGTIRFANLGTSTIGLMAQNGVFNIFGLALVTVPAGFKCNVLQNPSNPSDPLKTIWYAQPFMGFPYVVAEFASGHVQHYWIQETTTWAANTVYQPGDVAIPLTTPTGLEYIPSSPYHYTTWAPGMSISNNSIVVPTIPNGFFFVATLPSGETAAFTGAVEPTWPTTIGAMVNDFSDFTVNNQVGITGTPVAPPLSQSITDKYGNSQAVAGLTSTGATNSALTVPNAANAIVTWTKATIYQPGALVIPSTNTGAVVNAIPNGDFALGNVDWTFTGGGTQWNIVFATAPPSPSSGYEAVCPPGATSAIIIMNTAAAVTPGTSVTATCYLTTGTSSPPDLALAIGLKWYSDSAGTVLISTDHSAFQGYAHGWFKTSFTATAPAGAKSVKFFTQASSGTSSRDSAGMALASWNLATPAAVTNFIYEAVQTGPGVSGNTEPAWPTNSGGTVVDNTVTWEAVGSSVIEWKAYPIMESGAVEPTWPTTVGQSVGDGSTIFIPSGVPVGGNFTWTATCGQITDSNCPQTKAVVTGATHIFAGNNDVVDFSAAVNPTDWTSASNAGDLPTGLQQYGTNPVAVLGLYRSNLIVMNSGGYQMWQIDPDPSSMALLDAQPIGSVFTRSGQTIANDFLFLTPLGVRNIGTTGATANMQTGYIGQPVDSLIIPQVVAAASPPSAPPINFTALNPIAGVDVGQLRYANGYMLAIDDTTGNVYKSTDDAVTWTHPSTTTVLNGVAAYGNGVWVVVGSFGVQRSTDDAGSWTTPTGVPGATQYFLVATDGAGNWLALHSSGASSSAIVSSNNGASWSNAWTGGIFNFLGLIWDGSHFVASWNDVSGQPFVGQWTGSGWTSTQITAWGTNFPTNIVKQGSNYIIGNSATGKLRFASTLAGLATATDVTTTLSSCTGIAVVGSNFIFQSDGGFSSGAVSVSIDAGATFTTYDDTLNASFHGDGQGNGFAYDSVNNVLVVSSFDNAFPSPFASTPLGASAPASIEPIALYYPARGQYWLIFGPQAFVLTVTGQGQITWSRYLFPDVIKDWTLSGSTLYLRSAGGIVWQIDPNTYMDDVQEPNSVVTISNASPAVVTLANHGLLNGDVVVFTTTGTLPAPLQPNTTYFVTAKTTNTFELYASPWVTTPIATTTAGSGTHHLATTGIPFYGTIQWPWLDFGMLGFNKLMAGFDMVGTGLVAFSVDWDESNPGVSVTPPYPIYSSDTMPGQPIAFPLNAPSYSIILNWFPNQAWEWNTLNIYAGVFGSTG